MSNKEYTSYIAQGFIADGGKVNELLVISSDDFENRDWISKKKFLELNNLKPKNGVLEYKLKLTLKGNPDENKRAQIGKAIKLELLENEVKIEVYTQSYSEDWLLSHTHVLERTLYEAYVRVFLNNADVDQAENEKRSPKNFSLNLG